MLTVQESRRIANNPRFCMFLGAFLLFGLSGRASLHAQSTWTGATNTNWFTNTNWDTLIAPNGITIDVIVGAPSPTIANGTININSLTVNAGGDLQTTGNFNFGGTATTTLINAGSISVGNNSDFQLSGTVNNSGSISAIYAGGSVTSDLEVVSGGATLGGGGTITLFGNNARVMGLTGAVLTVNDQTIQGYGQVGDNTLGLIINSAGTIDANSSGNTLIVDTAAAGATNLGLMRASGGGNLRISGSIIGNTGGSIQALSGSTVQLDDSTITGGTLSGAGLFEVLGGTNVFLSGLTHTGTMAVANNSDLGITGTINNTGSISLNHTGGAVHSDLEIQSTGATLDGGGTITMFGNNARVTGGLGGNLMIANQTIQGYGNVGTNNLSFTNSASGLIDANSSGNTMTIDTAAAGATNLGLMRASGGGNMRISGSIIDNTGGSIQALSGSTVQLTNSTITGGTLSGAGMFEVVSGTNVFLSGLTHSGTMAVATNSDLGITGTINNTGSISLNHTGGAVHSELEIQSTGATLDGGGTITMFGNNARVTGGLGGNLLIANQTIQGYGNVGTNNLNFTNSTSGLIDANSSGNTLIVDPIGVSAVAWTNDGILRASNGGTLNLVNATVNNGTIDAVAGSIVQAFSIINNGIMQGNGLVDITGGLTNNGLISAGASAGTLTIEAATASFGSTSQLLIEIEGAGAGQFDLVDINFANSSGQLVLGGDLLVDLDEYLPNFSDVFVVLTANDTTTGGDIFGAFANVADGGFLTTVGGEGYFTVSYGGPLNGNQVLLSNFILTVPEPGSAAVVMAGMLLAISFRRRRV